MPHDFYILSSLIENRLRAGDSRAAKNYAKLLIDNHSISNYRQTS